MYARVDCSLATYLVKPTEGKNDTVGGFVGGAAAADLRQGTLKRSVGMTTMSGNHLFAQGVPTMLRSIATCKQEEADLYMSNTTAHYRETDQHVDVDEGGRGSELNASTPASDTPAADLEQGVPYATPTTNPANQ